MSTEPSAIPVAAANRPSKAILAEDVGITFPSYGLIATEKTIDTRKDALKKLVQVQQKAWAYIRDGHIDEAADAIIKQRPNAKLDKKVLADQIKLTIDFFDTPNTKGKPIGYPVAGRLGEGGEVGGGRGRDQAWHGPGHLLHQ